MQPTFFSVIRDQLTVIPDVVKADLSGKTVIVTGANIGLGFETAKHLARMNPEKLILACRSQEKGEKAVEDIKRDTGCQSVEIGLLDLADFASVKEFVRKFEDENDRLDILIENAAVAFMDHKTPQFTRNGWEQTIQVNDLSPSLLAILLLPRLVHTGRTYRTTPRIVVVTSGLHCMAKFETKVIESQVPGPLRKCAHKDWYKGPITVHRYNESKLLNVYFARALHSRLPPQTPLIVNYVTPGLCYSGLRRDISGLTGFLFHWLFERPLAWTSELGSRAFVFAAVGNDHNRDVMKGVYVGALSDIIEPGDRVLSPLGKTEEDILWSDRIRELKEVDPSIEIIIKNYLSN